MTGLLTGSTAIALHDRRLARLEHFAAARDGAAGADAADEDVDLAAVSRQISSAVVLRWISGLAGFLNCCGMNAFGSPPSSWNSSLGLGDGPAHAALARRQHDLGPERLQQPAALQRHALGHGDHELVAAGGAGEGEADAGVAAGRLDDDGVLGWIFPAFSAASIMATPMRSLTDQSGLKFSSLASDGGLGVADDAAQADQRRVADALGDVVVNATAKGGVGHDQLTPVGEIFVRHEWRDTRHETREVYGGMPRLAAGRGCVLFATRRSRLASKSGPARRGTGCCGCRPPYVRPGGRGRRPRSRGTAGGRRSAST